MTPCPDTVLCEALCLRELRPDDTEDHYQVEGGRTRIHAILASCLVSWRAHAPVKARSSEVEYVGLWMVALAILAEPRTGRALLSA